MKKAKIALTAIAIVTVIGGAFAFKAARISSPFFSTGLAGRCTVPFNTLLTTKLVDAQSPATFAVPYGTESGGVCNTIAYIAL